MKRNSNQSALKNTRVPLEKFSRINNGLRKDKRRSERSQWEPFLKKKNAETDKENTEKVQADSIN